MRGKALRGFQVHVDAGITPACAGKSFRPIWGVEKTPDHPRMCGEKLALYNELNNHQGSPPHVRGKVECVIDTVGMRGITPACAGKRNKLQGWSAVHQDHPRMCGEKATGACTSRACWGSPPHVRGKVDGCAQLWPFDRITPACAGKRLKRSRSTVPPVAIVPLFPSVCNKPVVSDGSPAGRDAPLFLPAENAVPASPAYNLRSL